MRRIWAIAVGFAAVLIAASGAAEEPGYWRKTEQTSLLLRKALHPTASEMSLWEIAGSIAPRTLPGESSLPPPKVQPDISSSPEVGRVRVDFALAQFAVQSRSRYDLGLLPALASSQEAYALILKSGSATLLQLAAAAAQYTGAITPSEGRYRLNVPLIVWMGAALRLSPGDFLELNKAKGSFLLVLGHLSVESSVIASAGGVNERMSDFRPFIFVAMSGSADVRGTTFDKLGYGAHMATSGLSFARGGLFAAEVASAVQDSMFIESGPLVAEDAEQLIFSGNRFIRSSGAAMIVQGGAGIRLFSNIVAGSGSHGIKITSDAAAVSVENNLVVGARGNGIFVDGAHDLTIRRNLVADAAATGIGVGQASCVLVDNNVLLGNGQKGVSVVASDAITILRNEIVGNGSAGIAIERQSDLRTIEIAENRIADNRIGLDGYDIGRVHLSANDLRRQTPRLLAGEMAQYTSLVLSGPGDLTLPTRIPTMGAKVPTSDRCPPRR